MKPLADGTLPPEGSPYWIALQQFDDASNVLKLDESMSDFLRHPKRELSLPETGHWKPSPLSGRALGCWPPLRSDAGGSGCAR